MQPAAFRKYWALGVSTRCGGYPQDLGYPQDAASGMFLIRILIQGLYKRGSLPLLGNIGPWGFPQDVGDIHKIWDIHKMWEGSCWRSSLRTCFATPSLTLSIQLVSPLPKSNVFFCRDWAFWLPCAWVPFLYPNFAGPLYWLTSTKHSKNSQKPSKNCCFRVFFSVFFRKSFQHKGLTT